MNKMNVCPQRHYLFSPLNCMAHIFVVRVHIVVNQMYIFIMTFILVRQTMHFLINKCCVLLIDGFITGVEQKSPDYLSLKSHVAGSLQSTVQYIYYECGSNIR